MGSVEERVIDVRKVKKKTTKYSNSGVKNGQIDGMQHIISPV